MKTIGYRLFALVYYVFRLLPMKKNHVFCIMTHDGSEDSNVGMVVKELKNRSEKYTFSYMKKEDRSQLGLVSFFIKKPYELARAQYIFLDNIFLPMAYMKFRKKTKVIQLWHGTGTIKKFGQDANEGHLKELEKKANESITFLAVNSKNIVNQYQGAFGISKDRVVPCGLPRTDTLFHVDKFEISKESLLNKYPILSNKKVILYAPTFRDEEVDNPKVELDIEKLLGGIDEDYILILKLHPHVANNFKLSENLIKKCGNRVMNLSSYDDLNGLLRVANVLITDYSSIVFEYCLEKKPMIFYAYDLETFSKNGRGFYEDYESFVPGPVAYTTDDLVDIINGEKYQLEKCAEFISKHYDFLDGQSTKRVVDRMINN